MQIKPIAAAAMLAVAFSAHAAQGPSSSQDAYLTGVAAGVGYTSILTTGDAVGGYRMGGIPDGLGAFDNNDGTFTVLMNHELGSTSGVARAHGGIGAYVSEWVINKSDLSVVSGRDLIQSVYGWNATTQASNSTASTFSFNRFCSADLAPTSAFYNAATGMGTTARLFLNGEEGGSTGYALANVASGANKGTTFVLGKFNTATNGSGGTAVGGWENLLANPNIGNTLGNKTVVIGNNDGGTGIMSNSVGVYVGTKTNVGTDADKAGLTNGTIKFVNVAGVTNEISNTTTRTTGIANGTRFSLNATASTTFSRPEDGAWSKTDANVYYFVTTDRLDNTDTAGGTQKGGTRLWRLKFDDVTNTDAGGVIDVLYDSTTNPGGLGVDKPNMFDNMSVNDDGTITLLEDTGGANHLGKIWTFDTATGGLTLTGSFKSALFGNLKADGSFVAGSHATNDEETSGVIDITSILGRNDGKTYSLLVAQDHKDAATLKTLGFMDAGANAAAAVEGGQLLLQAAPAVPEPETYALMAAGLGLVGAAARRASKK